MGESSIRASQELLDELHRRKQRGDSYEDVIWRLIDRVNDLDNPTDAREDRETAAEREEVARDPQPSESERRDETASSEAGSHGPEDWVGDHLELVEFPAGRDRDECISAVTAAYTYIHDNHRASMRELVTNVMPDHPLGYELPELDEGDRYRGAWWRRVVKPGLEELPGVDKPTGGGEWRYTGPD